MLIAMAIIPLIILIEVLRGILIRSSLEVLILTYTTKTGTCM